MAPLSTIMTSAAAVNLAARGFSYHDNAVAFKGVTVNAGSFTVKDLSISSGQDPKGYNKRGDVHSLDWVEDKQDDKYAALMGVHNGVEWDFAFTFAAGRHKTGTVADFWNNQIPPSQNTFGHTADELNFAFIGDMTLMVGGDDELFINDIGFAQGSDASGSNWWFGGKNCQRSGSYQVQCTGNDVVGRGITAYFTRGDKGDVNDIYLDSWNFI